MECKLNPNEAPDGYYAVLKSEAARQAGYTVIDYGEGGTCETTDTWDHKSVKHIVTILPRI